MITKAAGTKQGWALVTFELPSSTWAERVNLVGEFNGWDTKATPMTCSRNSDGWTVAVELEVGQSYRFRYLVDGHQWLNEWHADDWVDNSYGSDDSVVDLTSFGRSSSS